MAGRHGESGDTIHRLSERFQYGVPGFRAGGCAERVPLRSRTRYNVDSLNDHSGNGDHGRGHASPLRIHPRPPLAGTRSVPLRDDTSPKRAGTPAWPYGRQPWPHRAGRAVLEPPLQEPGGIECWRPSRPQWQSRLRERHASPPYGQHHRPASMAGAHGEHGDTIHITRPIQHGVPMSWRARAASPTVSDVRTGPGPRPVTTHAGTCRPTGPCRRRGDGRCS